MNLLQRLGSMFRASGPEDPTVPLGDYSVLLDVMGSAEADSGVLVNERTAMRLSAVQACVRVIAETLGSLPLNVYQRIERGKLNARNHRMYPLLHDAPNKYMSAITFREAVTAQVLLWGNGYAEIQRDRSGRVASIWPLPSDRTRPVRKGDDLMYETTVQAQLDGYLFQVGMEPGASGNVRYLAPDDVLHIPGLSFNGILGMSPIQIARQTVGLSLAAEKFGSLFFGNGSRPSGILSHPGRLREEARKNIERSFTRATSRENAHKAIVLEEGVAWTPMSVPPDDAQFVETRQFQIAEIARLFRVPLHMIQDLSMSTNNNIEQQSIEFVMHTVRPWAIRWEQELVRKLFTGAFFAEHDISGLLRGDFQSRMAGYTALRNVGAISANDIRQAEGYNPVSEEEGGDILLAPLNMVPLETLAGAEEPETPTDPGEDDNDGEGVPDDPNNLLRGRIIAAYRKLFADAVGRTIKRSVRDGKTTRAIFGPVLCAMAECIVALEFPHPGPLSAAGQVAIANHSTAISQRAGAWKHAGREQAAATEAGLAYDALRAKLTELMEVQ